MIKPSKFIASILVLVYLCNIPAFAVGINTDKPDIISFNGAQGAGSSSPIGTSGGANQTQGIGNQDLAEPIGRETTPRPLDRGGYVNPPEVDRFVPQQPISPSITPSQPQIIQRGDSIDFIEGYDREYIDDIEVEEEILTEEQIEERILIDDLEQHGLITEEEARMLRVQEKQVVSMVKEPDIKLQIEKNLDLTLVPINLETALITALQKNFDIKTITARTESTRWDYYNALADFLPDITYQFDISRVSGDFLVGGIVPVTITQTPLSSSFILNWDVFTGFRRVFDARVARNLYNANRSNTEFTKDQVLFNTASQYYRLLQDKFNIQVFTTNLRQREQQLLVNQQRFAAGVGTKFDVLRAEAELAAAQQNLIQAYNKFRLDQAQLANSMGINVFCPLYPVETTISQIKLVDENCDLCTLASTALKYRDDLNAARYNVKAAEARKNAALARFSPTISLNAQRADAGSVQQGVNSNQAIQLVATWTADGLFAEQYTLYRSLKALQKESEYQAVTLARNIKQSLVNSYYESKTSNERVKAAFEEVVASNESVRLANLRMQAGVGVFLDVLQAQATATESKVRYINAIIDYNIAQAQLLFDSGIISVNNLLCGKVIRTTNLDEIAVEDSNATGVIPQLPVKTP